VKHRKNDLDAAQAKDFLHLDRHLELNKREDRWHPRDLHTAGGRSTVFAPAFLFWKNHVNSDELISGRMLVFSFVSVSLGSISCQRQK
jgi:hypothetical protein